MIRETEVSLISFNILTFQMMIPFYFSIRKGLPLPMYIGIGIKHPPGDEH